MLEQRLGDFLAHHEAAGGLSHGVVEAQAGTGDGVQGAVIGAGQAELRAEAAAGDAGRRAGQAGRDGSWLDGVSHSVVEGLGAHCEPCGTFFHTAPLKEVVARVALCSREREKLKSAAALTIYPLV